MMVPQKIKNIIIIWAVIPLLGVSPKDWKQGLKEIFVHPCS